MFSCSHFHSVVVDDNRLYELAISCVEDGDNLVNCECPTPANLLTIGTLTCATQEERFVNPPACPLQCPVCEVRFIMGCLGMIGCYLCSPFESRCGLSFVWC
jgi:hypothetical protein